MKTVTLDDEAYRLLKGAKLRQGESFSNAVKRLLGPRRAIEDSAGSWSGMSAEEAARLRGETMGVFGTTKDDDPRRGQQRAD